MLMSQRCAGTEDGELYRPPRECRFSSKSNGKGLETFNMGMASYNLKDRSRMLPVEEGTRAKTMNQIRVQETLTLGVIGDEAGDDSGK